ncbi:KR domain-containing protein [Streptomyces pratensis]|uniref:KR domain-containing protein n=1 Tax=Streptomyces pratensis TaxID=1169025 RepID=UPI00362698BC
MTTITEAAPATGSRDATADGIQPVHRMLWHLAPAGATVSARPLSGRTVVVVADESDVADRVRALLRARGAEVADARSWTGAGNARGQVPDTIVDLTLRERFAPDARGQWRDALLRTFAVLRHCYESWSAETAAGRISYLAVTYLGGGMGYHPDDDLVQPLGGLWAGLAKTLHRELPNCAARILDVPMADTGRLPELIADELGLGGLSEIGHRDGHRWTLTPEAAGPGPATLAFDASDTLLMSGGGRGIGMALARRLAAEHGMRVVVTGRSGLPAPETWADLTPEALQERRRALWAQHRDGRPVTEIRRDIARAESTWDLVGNLLRARSDGLRIDYRSCDFTDREQVEALVTALPGLTAVIHNAGVDRPMRLPGKSDADITEVVATKVDSFLHLFQAVRGRELKTFCTVGSLTGRLGGMVGQFDYAAANECLGRLGLWAQRQVSFPVMTLAWPTWARLGLIANFEASLRYMAAMGVADGLAHWHAEMLAGTRGEVSYVGPLGQALDPVQAVSYPMAECLPGFPATYPKIFHLGVPEYFRAHERLLSVVEFDPAGTPAVGDFTIHGEPALPVGLLLENAVRGAEWIVPDHLPPQALLSVEDLSVPWALLRPGTDGRIRLRREVRGAETDGRWRVDVTFHADSADTGARMRLVFGSPDEAAGTEPLPSTARHTGEATLFTEAPVLGWRGLAVPLAAWRQEGAHQLVTEVGSCHPGDLWAVPQPPACAIPIAAIENIVRAVSERIPGLPSTPDPLTVHGISMRGPVPERTRITVDPALGVWRVTDAATGAPVAVLHRPCHSN